MELEIVRRIRGNVHGTVDLTALEDRALAHPYVQRLRRIRQLAFLSYVFPGATHSRFEHSLGVMQLAGATWTKMRANQVRLAATCGRYRDFAQVELQGVAGLVHGLLAPTFPLIAQVFGAPEPLQALRLAGFLHDLGHPPFSHSGERFLPSWREMLAATTSAPRYLRDYLEARCDVMAENGRDPAKTPVRHEIYTLHLVERLMSDILRDAAQNKVQGEVLVSARDVLSVIMPDIEPEPGSPLSKYGVWRLLHELVSGEFDIDRMDYLLRDSRECGVVYGIFDATRIQDSLCIYVNPEDRGLHLGINYSGLAAFEDYLRARMSMYLQLYFHKTSVAAEAMMQHLARMAGGWRLPADPEAFAGLDEYNIEGALLAAGDGIEDVKQRDEFKSLVSDLLRTRRLWKRVFEVAGKDAVTSKPHVERACKTIEKLGVPYERLSSASSLTNFRPRGEGEISRNYLRLVKKDAEQFPRVVPIEDHANVVGGNSSVHITRLYVPDEMAGKVKQALTGG
jgi:HD superfamily phosphohydrolase